MKFLIIGDLHGQMPNIHYRAFDAIIAPGDFCSDAPKEFMMKSYESHDWYDLTGKKKAKEMVKKSLEDGRKILEFLNSFGVPVYVVPGNWDWIERPYSWEFLRKDYYHTFLLKGLENVIDVHQKSVDVGDIEIVGNGITSEPELPQHKELLEKLSKEELNARKKDYEKRYGAIDRLLKKAKKPVLFLSHNVPFGTKIDQIVNPSSPRNGYHYGSFLTREIIDKYQPLICIGGHMHEHFDKCNVGKTVCINSGYGSNVNVFLEIVDGKIKKLEFFDGKKVKK